MILGRWHRVSSVALSLRERKLHLAERDAYIHFGGAGSVADVFDAVRTSPKRRNAVSVC